MLTEGNEKPTYMCIYIYIYLYIYMYIHIYIWRLLVCLCKQKTKESTRPKLQSELCFLMASGCRRVNNPTLWDFCVSMIGRADIDGSNSNVRMNAWLPQASYLCWLPPMSSALGSSPVVHASGHVGVVGHVGLALFGIVFKPGHRWKHTTRRNMM